MIALLPALLWCAAPQTLGPPVPREVKAVATLAPSLSEVVVALGRQDALVGVSRFDENPALKNVKRIGGFNDPSVEAVVALEPDVLLVQMSPGNQRPVEKIASLGIPVVALPLTSVQDVYDAILRIGALLGRAEKAKALTDALDSTRAEVKARAAARKTKPKVMLCYGYSPLVVAGKGSFADELLAEAGAENVARGNSPYPVLSPEKALTLGPDVVIDAADSPQGKDALMRLPGLKKARWVSLKTRALLQPGADLGQGLLELEKLLFSEPK